MTFKIFKYLTRSLPISEPVDKSYQFGNSVDLWKNAHENKQLTYDVHLQWKINESICIKSNDIFVEDRKRKQ